ncbi:MAG: hypothetical protein KGJ86_20130 [Chloroflexota bacterium]|nr:hypothetical protein [Chloroflexota bacterium]
MKNRTLAFIGAGLLVATLVFGGLSTVLAQTAFYGQDGMMGGYGGPAAGTGSGYGPGMMGGGYGYGQGGRMGGYGPRGASGGNGYGPGMMGGSGYGPGGMMGGYGRPGYAPTPSATPRP